MREKVPWSKYQSDHEGEERVTVRSAAKALLLVPALSGCDIVQGFQDAGNALFPEQSTHLSTPALRLVSGGYRRLDLAAGRELSVLARPSDGGTSLFVMRFANPKPCEIPDVGRYVASRNPKRAEAGIAYFHEDVAQGTLHFADTACQTFDLAIDDARLPLGETERTVIVWAAGDLLEVDPPSGKKTTLSSGVTGIVTRAFGGRTLVVTGDQLEVFDSEWKSQGKFGKGINGLIKTNTGALYLDSSGLRRMSAGPDNATTKDGLIMADACRLGMRDDTWATFHSPCAEGHLRALNEPSGKLYDLELDAEPQYLRLLPARGSAGVDPTADPFWFLFLRHADMDATFIMRDPRGVEHTIGEHAGLDHSDLVETSTHTYGYAMVNVDGGTADYVYFDAAGETKTLARKVLTRPGRLVMDWDGVTGTLVAVSGDRLVSVATRVPERGFEFPDNHQEWTVFFNDWQGDSGRLSRMVGTLDALQATPVEAPFASPKLEEVAPSVGAFTTASLGLLIPGTMFLADYDATNATGRLSYENAELRFKATVDHGVSDYIITSDEVLYTIPFGRDRGIWLATGK